MKCYKDIILNDLGGSAKELAESSSAVRAALWRLSLRDVDVKSNGICLAVGDGIRPRTGGLFAYLTKFCVYSIDPQMGNSDSVWVDSDFPKGIDFFINTKIQLGILGLHTRKQTIEEWCKDQKYNNEIKELVILQVHSHARLENFYYKVKELFPNANITTISIPCCMGQLLHHIHPTLEYKDYGIFGPKRHVKVWEELKC